MQFESIEYQADGRRMIGQLALPSPTSAKRPGILVAHEALGLAEHAKRVAHRLASLGYVAFALDYVGEGKIIDIQTARPLLGELMAAPERIRALGNTALEILAARPEVDASRLGAVGYCFGGTLSLELARGGADVKAVVGMHSGLTTVRPGDARNIKGKVMVCIGSEDPLIPAEQRLAFEKEMREGSVDWRMNLYGGAWHSFTNPEADHAGLPGLRYDHATDERSWRAMIDLFDEALGKIA
jgi:dienelactone hydrolase